MLQLLQPITILVQGEPVTSVKQVAHSIRAIIYIIYVSWRPECARTLGIEFD